MERSFASMRSDPYDIVLLPEAGIATKAIQNSKELEVLDTLFTLGTDTYAPHVSLYMTQLKAEDLAKAGQQLAAIASATPPILLEADSYVRAEGYIDANYIRTQAIRQLQATVIQAINPLRDGMYDDAKQQLQAATGLARQNLEQYGDWRVGDLFRPHLTLTRFAKHDPIPLEDLPAPTAFSGNYTMLAIFEMDDNGTCLRKIQEFKLGGTYKIKDFEITDDELLEL